MSGHTKGPWKAHEYKGCFWYIHSVSEPYAERIATISYSDGVHSKHEANARLIAAAPELLAALQELMQIREWSIRAGGMEGPLPHDILVKFAEMQIPAVDRALAAIAKATEGK